MTTLTPSQHRAQAKVDQSRASSGRRLTCSQDPAQVLAIQKEFFRAGIAVETRNNPVAASLGISGVELWVTNERDFFAATKFYAELQARTSGKGGGASVPRPAQTSAPPPLKQPEPGRAEPANQGSNGTRSNHASPPQREDLEQATTFLEKEIDELVTRDRGLVSECGSLRSKLEEMGQALAEARAAVAREADSRAAAEREQAEKVSGLQNALERERLEWQRQLKSRDCSLQVAQKQLEAKAELLQTHQAAIVELRDAMVAVDRQRESDQEALLAARQEAARQREARLAAEERVKAAAEAQRALEQQLREHMEVEQRLQQAHLASISSLRGKLQANRAGSASPDVLQLKSRLEPVRWRDGDSEPYPRNRAKRRGVRQPSAAFRGR